MKRTILVLTAMFAIALVGGYLFSSTTSLKLDQFAPGLPGGDFELQANTGPVKLSDFRGKITLIYFGYTYCPDICPTSLALTSAALRLLDDAELDQVQVIFISVDPARDTVARLAEYAPFFHPDIIGVTGSKQQIDDVARRFGAYYKIPDHAPEENYPVDHSSQTVLVGKDGKVKTTIAHGTAPDEMVKTIRAYF